MTKFATSSNYWHLPTRLLLIDSDHEYEPMKRLIPPAMKCVSEGGWLVMHDYEPGWDGVVKAVNEFLDSQTFYELTVYLTESLLCIRKDERRLYEKSGHQFVIDKTWQSILEFIGH